MKTSFLFIIFGMMLGTSIAHSQQDINQKDESGQRHGYWEKYYPETEQLRYKGTFHHGKEKGEFKFYCEECGDTPNAIISYNKGNHIAQVKYFDLKGKLISEGKMDNQKRIGEWVYYHENSDQVMSRENYSDGKLHGRTTTYYPNEMKTEEINYKDGIQDGENNYYSSQGVLLKKLLYKDGKLHGPAFYYDAHGQTTIEGAYKEGKKDGLWKYFENGNVVLEEEYPIEHDKKPQTE